MSSGLLSTPRLVAVGVLLLGLCCNSEKRMGAPRYEFVGYGNVSEARQMCKKYKGLPMPETEAEQDALQETINASLRAGLLTQTWPNTTIWLGGRWSGVWEWDDGTPVGEHAAASEKLAHMISSALRHQDDTHVDEPWMCGMLNGRWKDTEGNWKFGVICELEPVIVEQPTATATTTATITSTVTSTSVTSATATTTNTFLEQRHRDVALLGGVVGGAVGAIGVGVLGGVLGSINKTASAAVQHHKSTNLVPTLAPFAAERKTNLRRPTTVPPSVDHNTWPNFPRPTLAPTIAPLLAAAPSWQSTSLALVRVLTDEEVDNSGHGWPLLPLCLLVPALVVGIPGFFYMTRNKFHSRTAEIDGSDEDSTSSAVSPMTSARPLLEKNPRAASMTRGSSNPEKINAAKHTVHTVQRDQKSAPEDMAKLRGKCEESLQQTDGASDPAQVNAVQKSVQSSRDTVEVTFGAGPLGMTITDDKVVSVHDSGQAQQLGVQVGWIVSKVGDDDYTREILQATKARGTDFVVVFKSTEDASILQG